MMPKSFTDFTESSLGTYRGQWWNKDFLDLMGDRWELSTKRQILDLGSGMGHWAAEILPRAAWDARITLLEVVPDLLDRSREPMRTFGNRAEFRCGSVYELPFADEQFDFVTAQTVFMHLESPKAALREALRVLKPGGVLAVCEPNNLLQSQICSLEEASLDTSERLNRVASLLAHQEGKRTRGHGDDAIGSLIHRLFVDLRLSEVRTFVSDKVWVEPTSHMLYPTFIFLTSGKKPA